jgi:hypothetical protein
MKTLNNDSKIPSSAHERMQEIGKILSYGIRRLELKERSQNLQIPVDNKTSPSLHSVDSNINQQAML